MTEDEFKRAKAKVRQRYDGWVLGSIKQTYEATKDGADGSSPLAAFILTSCAIDFLAGFYCGIESFTRQSSKNYKEFVKEYMPQYDPEDVYIHVRCMLAHSYTIGGGLGLTHNDRDIHDPHGHPGRRIINFENFLEDFEACAEAYFEALDSSAELRKNFENRWKLGFIDTGPLQLSRESAKAAKQQKPLEKPTRESKKDCTSCDWASGEKKPVGDIVRLPGKWMLNHYQNKEQGFLGWLALQPELHTEEWDDLKDAELQALGPNIKRIKQTLRKHFSEDNIERIYVIYLFESPFDKPPGKHHLHIHLIPRFAKMDSLLREPTKAGSGINAWNIYRLTKATPRWWWMLCPKRWRKNAFPEEYRWKEQKIEALMEELRELL